ncbi:hypothetical protein [Ancylobacter defluvii]|uniref:hypothetical protein n=1 Tax=Ancylobacter defluvii TaxID=1282440 RepID=UPI001BCAF19C|nr:hypothetical protein [Ancylobacter defluvii]MBS7590139.1 hypothetical protein [Ancylobacter defluvii]
MTTSIVARKRSADIRPSHHTARWIGLAASPAFALMAWASANDMQNMLCASAPGILPLGGMAFMYLLMSFFHLSPWLRLAPALLRQPPLQDRED